MGDFMEKKYITDNPILISEWNYEKNIDLDPSRLTLGSNKKVWWKCKKYHEWESTIYNRNKGAGCPYCAGKKVLVGYNDLQTINQTIANEWNYEKNNGLNPTDFVPYSNKKVWWKCSEGHEWQASINHRSNGRRCPYCIGKKVLKGYNDLATVNPSLANEWNHEKNLELVPTSIAANSDNKVWWKCKKGHEWKARISSRNKGGGCPVCNSEHNTSFPEYAILFYLRKYGIEVEHSYKKLGYELDIYIPLKKIAIEYDGYFWHKNRVKNDLEKNSKCKKDGVKLYRLREDLPVLNDSSWDFVVHKKRTGLREILEKILSEIIENNVEINFERDAIEIENLREYTEKEKSLLCSNPILAGEWNYEKNNDLKPSHVTIGSDKKVWWKCGKGHEWKASIGSRSRGSGCPYCSNKKILQGYNDLTTLNPILASEWNYEKNGELKPENFTANSHYKAWWKCNKGHEWQTVIASRNAGVGCPYCSGRKKLDSK